MIKCLFESIQIKVVSDIILINFTEKLMILKVAEPPNPAFTFFRAVLGAVRHSKIIKVELKKYIFDLII